MAGCGGDDDDGGASQADSAAGGNADGSPGSDGAASPDGGEGRADAAGGMYPLQLIRPACAPNDAPAVRILLGSRIDEDVCAVSAVNPNVNLELWTTEIQAPVTFSFAPTEAIGRGIVCPGGNLPCQNYDTGEIHFDTYKEAGGATGQWRLLAGEREVSGTFDSTWCDPDPPEPCG